METILSYLRQPSTWRGIIAIGGSFGVAISPELSVEIVAFGIALAGVIEVYRNEHKK